ncbi:hypothetical protein MMC14_009501 [Varicellaria rhodocarpa]|nr:hypothetical protein [Varicellaria rhodocarpa]
MCMNSPYGPGAIAFEFAQVGKDQAAQAFLGQLDKDPDSANSAGSSSWVLSSSSPERAATFSELCIETAAFWFVCAEVGRMIDATSYYELEAEEYKRKGVTLTPDLWLVKLMVGAVDQSFDEQD